MGIKELAAADAEQILGTAEAGSPFVIVNPGNVEFPVSGTFGDIGLLMDPETGAPVQGQTIAAAYPMRLLKEQTGEVPEKGWRVKAWDLSGVERIYFVVRPPIHDWTIGITRLQLGVNL